jgi:hypothetical protein
MAVFMIGTQRSGSNLLRVMLNQLPEIAAPHPPHVLERIGPLLPGYGDLAHDDAFALLVDDVCRLVEANPVPWDGVELDRAEVARRCREHSLVAVYGAVHDVMAQAWGARDWCCKSLANVHYLDELTRYFDAGKFLYLYRDGRDVAVSFSRTVVGEKHFYFIAQQWQREQRLALAVRDSLGPERVFSLSYEALTGDTKASMQALCEFLVVPYTDAVLRYSDSQEASRTAGAGSMWRNVTKPVMGSNTQKFRAEASAEDIRIFEAVAGETLNELGYPLVHEQATRTDFSEAEIAAYAAENSRLKSEVLTTLSVRGLMLREPQERLLAEIRSRSPRPSADKLP